MTRTVLLILALLLVLCVGCARRAPRPTPAQSNCNIPMLDPDVSDACKRSI